MINNYTPLLILATAFGSFLHRLCSTFSIFCYFLDSPFIVALKTLVTAALIRVGPVRTR